VTKTPSARVSIIDDDESIREALPDLLEQYGYSVRAFSSAHQFLASGEVSATQCVVLDFAMPGMSGQSLMHQLAARGHSVPIIFITAQSDEILRQRLLAEGAVACLFKPFTESELLAALNSALRA
jgi:FixJ family two-component response regulator